MTWFRELTGFDENGAGDVHSRLAIDGQTLIVKDTVRQYQCGHLETPSLAELRVAGAKSNRGAQSTLREVVGDVQTLHLDSRNGGALFQVASQFNLLEMVSPSRTPEDGVGCYEFDRTQGPACAIAAGAGTIYRNYFVDVPKKDGSSQVGQTEDCQLDMLSDFGRMLGNESARLWTMKNGYALPHEAGLAEIGRAILEFDDIQYDALRETLRVGVQRDTEVTLGQHNATPTKEAMLVTQVYASALPIAYSGLPVQSWRPFASAVLEASYEATLWAAVLNAEHTGNRRVYLTLLGGGAFGNPTPWIFDALEAVLARFTHYDLDIAMVSYGRANPDIARLIERTGLGM